MIIVHGDIMHLFVIIADARPWIRQTNVLTNFIQRSNQFQTILPNCGLGFVQALSRPSVHFHPLKLITIAREVQTLPLRTLVSAAHDSTRFALKPLRVNSI